MRFTLPNAHSVSTCKVCFAAHFSCAPFACGERDVYWPCSEFGAPLRPSRAAAPAVREIVTAAHPSSSPSKKSSPLLVNSPLERAQKRKGSTQHGFRRPDTLSPATRFFSSDVQDGACGPLSPHRRALVVVSLPPPLTLSSPLPLPPPHPPPALA